MHGYFRRRPDGDRETIDGVGSEGVEPAADDAEASLGDREPHAKASIFGRFGFIPEFCHLLQLVLKAIGCDLAGEMDFLFFGNFGLWGENIGEPLDDPADDLADARLGDVVFGGLGPGRAAGDVNGVIDFEIALCGREFLGDR